MPSFRAVKVKETGGFTIVESLISLLLLAVVLAGGISLYFYSDSMLSLATHKKMAYEIANAKLEEVKSLGAPLGTSTESIMIGGLNAMQSVMVVPIDEPPPDNITDYNEVTVQVSWREAGGTTPRTVTLVTFMSP